eukprot:293058-Prymnesium_polylepis.1
MDRLPPPHLRRLASPRAATAGLAPHLVRRAARARRARAARHVVECPQWGLVRAQRPLTWLGRRPIT